MQASECFAFCSQDLEVDLNFRHAYLWEPRHQAKTSANARERLWIEPRTFCLWYGTGLFSAAHPHCHLPHTPLQMFMGPEQNQNRAESLWQSHKHMMRCFLTFGSSEAWWFTAELRFGTGSSFECGVNIACLACDWQQWWLKVKTQDSRWEEPFWKLGIDPDFMGTSKKKKKKLMVPQFPGS
jgi:hypothetical protein